MSYHSGLTLLNLGLTGSPYTGWQAGRVSNLFGDTSTGKSLLALQGMAASAALYDNLRLVYLDAEMTISPKYLEMVGLSPKSVEVFKIKYLEEVDEFLSKNEDPAFIVLDSVDAVSVADDKSRSLDTGFRTQKAVRLSLLFQRHMGRLDDTGSHLLLISQIRQNLNASPYAPPYRRSGGKSLQFAVSQAVELSSRGKIGDSDARVGEIVRMKVVKNRFASPHRSVEVPLIYGVGFDEVGSLVEFLTEHEVIQRKGGYYNWEGQNFRKTDLISFVESDPPTYSRLIDEVEKLWTAREESIMAVYRRKKISSLLASKKETSSS